MQMSLRMSDELAARLADRIGMVAREKWVRELVERELDNPTHMPLGEGPRVQPTGGE